MAPHVQAVRSGSRKKDITFHSGKCFLCRCFNFPHDVESIQIRLWYVKFTNIYVSEGSGGSKSLISKTAMQVFVGDVFSIFFKGCGSGFSCMPLSWVLQILKLLSSRTKAKTEWIRLPTKYVLDNVRQKIHMLVESFVPCMGGK